MTYHPSPFRMKGAADNNRRSAPPHTSHVANGSAEIRCRTSKMRRHLSHWYSYVGTSPKAITLALALALGACATTTSEISETQRLQARGAYERALRSIEERQPVAALTAAQEAVGLDGANAVYRDVLGLVFNELLRPELALEQFQRAVELDPGYADAEFHRGVALAEQRRWDDAVAAFRRAASMPRLTQPQLVQNNLGMAYLNLKRYREAEEALQFALRLEPRLEAAHYHLGLVFTAEGRKDEARAAFRRVGELDPKSPFAQAALERLRDLGDGG